MSRRGRSIPAHPLISRNPPVAAPATAYTLVAPTPASGTAGVASGTWTITPNGLVASDTVTLSDGGSGTFSTGSTLTWTNSTAAQTFTYTPATSGVMSVTATSGAALTVAGSPSSYTSAGLINVYFLGDSFTGDSGSSNAIANSYYAQQLMTHLRDDVFYASGFSAIPGTKLEDFLAYSPAPSTFYNAAASLNICVLLGGANNFNAGDGAATAYAKLRTLVGTLRGYGFKVVACTLWSGNIIGGPASLSAGDYDVLRNAFNVLLRADWSFADALVDYASSQLMGKDGTYANTTYFADGLHPTNTGKLEHIHFAVGPIADLAYPHGPTGGTGGGVAKFAGDGGGFAG